MGQYLSLHIRRWISQCNAVGAFDISLFSTGAYTPQKVSDRLYSAQIQYLLKNDQMRWQTGLRESSVPEDLQLAEMIQTIRPDLIHSFDIPGASRLVLDAKARYLSQGNPDSFPKWITTSMGSDLYYFGQLPEYAPAAHAVMSTCDFHFGECPRDHDLAKSFGFQGEFLGNIPAAGGLDLEYCRKNRAKEPSARDLILIKGYQGSLGRALSGIEAISLAAPALKKFRIGIFGADPTVIQAAKKLNQLRIQILPWASHEEHLQRLGDARIYMGLSISDGVCISCLEAMAMGAFPIQSESACTENWFENEVGGFRVSPDNSIQLAEYLRRAASNDSLVDNAAKINDSAIQKLDQNQIAHEIQKAYQSATLSKGVRQDVASAEL